MTAGKGKPIFKWFFLWDCHSKSFSTGGIPPHINKEEKTETPIFLSKNTTLEKILLIRDRPCDLLVRPAVHGCLSLYSDHARPHHPPVHLFPLFPLHTTIHQQLPLPNPSLPFQHAPSPYIHPAQIPWDWFWEYPNPLASLVRYHGSANCADHADSAFHGFCNANDNAGTPKHRHFLHHPPFCS